jgi:hypothetical protein
MFKKRNLLQRLWLNDMFGSLSLAEIVGTSAVIVAVFWVTYRLL